MVSKGNPTPDERLANARRRTDLFLKGRSAKVKHAMADLIHAVMDDVEAQYESVNRLGERRRRTSPDDSTC